MKKSGRFGGAVFAFLSSICFGVGSVFGKLSFAGGNTPLSGTFYRGAVAAVCLLAVLVARCLLARANGGNGAYTGAGPDGAGQGGGRISTGDSAAVHPLGQESMRSIFGIFKLPKSYVPRVLLFGLAGQLLTSVLLSVACFLIPAGSATVLHFVYPAIVALAGVLFFRERLGAGRTAALVLAFVGVLFFFDGLGGGSGMGVAVALVSGVCWAFALLYLQHSGLARLPALPLSFYVCALMAGGTFLLALATGQMRWVLTPTAWLATLAAGALYASAVLFLQLGVQRAGPTVTAILGVFEPVASIAAGALVLGEALGPLQLVGAGVIISAVVVLALTDKTPAAQEERDEEVERPPV